MSMTQVAFLKKANLPTKKEIEGNIRKLGYEFEIHDNFESFYGIDGIECSINGEKTFFEIYFSNPTGITNEFDFIKKDLTDQDTAISFIWGTDFVAGASIGLISAVLIEKSKALIYYLNNEIKYSKEMLLADIPEFLKEMEREKQAGMNNKSKMKATKNEHPNLWEQIKSIWKK